MKYEDLLELRVGSIIALFREDEVMPHHPVFIISEIYSYSLPDTICADLHLIGTYGKIKEKVGSSNICFNIGESRRNSLNVNNITLVATMETSSFGTMKDSNTQMVMKKYIDEVCRYAGQDSSNIVDLRQNIGKYFNMMKKALKEEKDRKAAEEEQKREEEDRAYRARLKEEREYKRKLKEKQDKNREEHLRKLEEKRQKNKRMDERDARVKSMQKRYTPPENSSCVVKVRPDKLTDIIMSDSFEIPFYGKTNDGNIDINDPRAAREFLHLYQNMSVCEMQYVYGVSMNTILEIKDELIRKYKMKSANA